MKTFKHLILTILLIPTISLSATNDFVAGSNITVADVTFGDTTADLIILTGSTAESVTFVAGLFTVTNPGSYFKIGSSDSAVKSIQIQRSGGNVACSENTDPGSSYTTLPTATGTYTIRPSATTQCTDLCTLVSHASTYNTFPTCGAATCASGYRTQGTGSETTCVLAGGGGIFTGSVTALPGYVAPRQQTIYADGTVVYSDEVKEEKKEEVTTQTQAQQTNSSYSFSKNLYKGSENLDVISLQQKLRELNLFNHPTNTGYYGTVTENSVKAFQCQYNIICKGTPETTGYGVLGPKTRTKLNELNQTQTVEQSTETTTAALEKQLADLQQMVDSLLKELEALTN